MTSLFCLSHVANQCLPTRFPWILASVFLLVSCQDVAVEPDVTGEPSDLTCDEGNGGISLPDGFCAIVIADSVGRSRHIAVKDNGDIYAILRSEKNGGAIVAMRDSDGDGRPDQTEYFGDMPGTGLDIHNGYLYFGPNEGVWRVPLGDELVPTGEPEEMVGGFPEQRPHATKPFTFDGSGNMYVAVGSPSNVCQQDSGEPGSPGADPCAQRDLQASIWRFSSDQPGQTQQANGTKYASGVRNGLALDWNTEANTLFSVTHGRDGFSTLWGDLYDEQASAELPSEQFLKVQEGDDFGWPYCYYDHLQGKKVLSPEYGGDGTEVGRCADMADPILGFPGHWAPNDLVFYQGSQFPGRYHGGAFVAFHGSWNRGTDQQGYLVAFVPMDGGSPAGDWEVFASGFAGVSPIPSPGSAMYRPTGVAVGPDGSLYVTDDVKGKIWRIVYAG